ncbi:hypothetical protein KGD82_13755 [Nocardiopsis eucommiae]|uniref:Uncharacterized protein n=1 Tax=Nocardiopsis eucommiae TaxID=2831970 RepID=A0A975QM91_9ACTN|nr:hypothetical protein KGD82_13755 [Nocardiopsis eucommiae]
MTTQTFYRLHSSTRPFSADSAWSAPWGSEFTEDGSAYTCTACDGVGDQAPEVHESCDGAGCYHCEDGYITECSDCDGTGFIDCDRGYSCTWSAADLVGYFEQQHVTLTPDMGNVLVFEGEYSGEGCDGEPLAVPVRVIETITIPELIERAANEETE